MLLSHLCKNSSIVQLTSIFPPRVFTFAKNAIFPCCISLAIAIVGLCISISKVRSEVHRSATFCIRFLGCSAMRSIMLFILPFIEPRLLTCLTLTHLLSWFRMLLELALLFVVAAQNASTFVAGICTSSRIFSAAAPDE